MFPFFKLSATSVTDRSSDQVAAAPAFEIAETQAGVLLLCLRRFLLAHGVDPCYKRRIVFQGFFD